MRWLALPGVPAGPGVWSRLTLPYLSTHRFVGFQQGEHRDTWSLQSFVDEIRPKVDRETVLLGQNLGGLVAAVTALQTPVKAVVLTGTALGPWWLMPRMTAKWPLHYLFYNWYAGQRFMKKGVSPAVQQAFLAEFHSELHTPGLRAKMRLVGREMKPPVGLAGQLSSRTKVHLVWGTHDVHYPRWIPEVIRPLSQASLQWVNGGHYCMWENPTVFTRALENIRNNTL